MYSPQSQVLINGRVSSGNAFAIKTVLNQTCKSIRCRDHLGNKGAAERTRLIIQQKNKEAMNCRGAEIFTLTKNGKTRHLHSFKRRHDATTFSKVTACFKKRHIFKKKKTKSNFSFYFCVCIWFFFTFCTVTQRKRKFGGTVDLLAN